jgi:hypothetical protein
MAFNQKFRSKTPVGNFNFLVIITDAVTGDTIRVPIDSIKGLNDGTTNIIRHRLSSSSSAMMTPYAGLTTASPVTFEGVYFFDMEDIKKLQAWRQQVQGKPGVSILGSEYREITIQPQLLEEEGSEQEIAFSESGGVMAKESFFLKDCIATSLNLSDFDVNSPAFSTWTLTVEYSEMTEGAGS